ncbi:hypothetical protein [Brevibacillus sp. CF112]|uniref:hypothetical protein n=1 Tax=Brevibacillus sp. CF112 TaxID=1144311 RepID=UPI0002FF48E0|nr:hypothetical protein [Brevibacillus sp. CF112]
MLKLENGGNTLVIQAHKTILVLQEAEITKAVMAHTEIATRALKRGKTYKRQTHMANQKSTPANRRGREPTW